MTTILLIEDEEAIRNNIAEILGYEGYTVLTAENGAAGIDLARSTLPDLILCDVMMPIMDGYGVLATLREQPSTSNIPFIFLTARGDWTSVREGMALGADDYLIKPHTTGELLDAINTRLQKHHSIEHIHQHRLEDLRGNLIRMLPHELRTPLFGILGNAQLLELDYETLDRQDIQQMAAGIVAAGLRLQHVIENYLLYAQTELAGYSPAQMMTVAQQRVETPGLLIREGASAKAAQFERVNNVSIEAEDVMICIARESLRKIVDELLDNAFKFSEPGSLIEITGCSDGNVYVLRVSDQGRGMTPEQLQQIGVYMQFERNLYEQQGIGLGLILAQRLAQLYGGALRIASEVGRGTTITVELPLAT